MGLQKREIYFIDLKQQKTLDHLNFTLSHLSTGSRVHTLEDTSHLQHLNHATSHIDTSYSRYKALTFKSWHLNHGTAQIDTV